MPVLDYARSRLFDPLGIPSRPAAQPVFDSTPKSLRAFARADFAWAVDRQHHHTGYSELKLRPADMLKLGVLYLHDGRWHGKQVVPAAWVRASTTRQVTVPTFGVTHAYGYECRVGPLAGHPAFQARGSGGQEIAVVPALDLVFVLSQDVDPHVRPPDDGDAWQITDTVLTALTAP